MVFHTENPKTPHKKVLETINKFSEVAGYKIKIQKSLAFLYTDNVISEGESKKKNHFKNCIQKIILRNKPDQDSQTLTR